MCLPRRRPLASPLLSVPAATAARRADDTEFEKEADLCGDALHSVEEKEEDACFLSRVDNSAAEGARTDPNAKAPSATAVAMALRDLWSVHAHTHTHTHHPHKATTRVQPICSRCWASTVAPPTRSAVRAPFRLVQVATTCV